MRCSGSATEWLELLEELTCRARDVNSARDTAFAVLHALHDARRFAALGAIGTLGGIHDLLAVGCFCDLGAYCHVESLLMFRMCAQRSASTTPMHVNGIVWIHSGRI